MVCQIGKLRSHIYWMTVYPVATSLNTPVSEEEEMSALMTQRWWQGLVLLKDTEAFILRLTLIDELEQVV